MNFINKIYNKFAKKDIEYNGSKYSDTWFGIHTGAFHYVKRYIIPLLSPKIKKIDVSVNKYYGKTLSNNSKIFKKIISEMEEFDKDPDEGNTTGYKLGLSRKSFYILCMKFIVVLYDFDTHYMERGDYVIRRLIEEQNKLYFDEQSNPKNWYPNRNEKILGKYLIIRNREVKHE